MSESIHASANKRKVVMSQIIPEVIFESSFKHRVEMARTKVGDTKDVILFMIVDGIEKGTVTLLGYAIVTEEMSNDADSGAIYSKGKSIYEYFDSVKLHEVLAKYEKAAREATFHPKHDTAFLNPTTRGVVATHAE